MKPTIYDIAKDAGVSIATVSHVLNNKGRVGATTRQNVLRAIAKLGYERDALASALAGRNSYTIGFIVPDINNTFFPEVLRGAEDEAFVRGYSVFICNTDDDAAKEQAYLKTLRSKRMDGIIIATGVTPGAVIDELIQDGVRVVVVARELRDVSVGTVVVDNFRGGTIAAEHLLALGHRHIGFIAEPRQITSSMQRLAGFQAALSHVPSTKLYLSEDAGFGLSTGQRIATELLTQHPVTALFAVNDQLAIGALQACQRLGLRVPQDISLIGFDDTVLAKIVQPPLTTIAQPIYELGRQAVAMTISSIESAVQSTEIIVLPGELVVRESTAVVKM